MSEFLNQDPNKLGQEYVRKFDQYLVYSVVIFLGHRKYGADLHQGILDQLNASRGVNPKLSIQKDTQITFHLENMNAFQNVTDLKKYAEENGFGWLSDEEVKKCKSDTLKLMGLSSDDEK